MLEKELAASREYLQSIIQDLEAANEELQSANEEILSANDPESAAQLLIDAALEGGGTDNVTVVVAKGSSE